MYFQTHTDVIRTHPSNVQSPDLLRFHQLTRDKPAGDHTHTHTHTAKLHVKKKDGYILSRNAYQCLGRQQCHTYNKINKIRHLSNIILTPILAINCTDVIFIML